jgi:response regulator of citrate/malate metabolism
MDHTLPFKNGLETAIEIIRIHNESKIIFVRASDDIKDISLTIGAVKFLNKPFKIRK